MKLMGLRSGVVGVACAVAVLAVSTAQADTGPFQQPGVVPDTGPPGPGVLLVGSVTGNGLTFYDNEADFLAALPVSKTNRGLETFEENDLPDGTAEFLNTPLCSGIANVNFPDGLTGLGNVCVSSLDLAIATTGFDGIASDAVGRGKGTVGLPTVITFNQPPLPPGPFKTAVSLNLYSINSGGDVTVTVLDPAGNVLGSATYLGAGTTPTYAGIIVGPVQAIASIEVDSSGGFELVDDISPWSGPNCFAVVTEVVNCHADGSSFTYTVQGIDSCTGGMSTYSFTASGGAVGEEMCFTLLITDDQGGLCCSIERCVTVPNCVEKTTGQCAPVPPGLVSWWTGDLDASDSQGSNDGVLTNGAIAGAPGLVGGAFQLDGVNDRIITTDANVNLANLTVAAWINPDDVSGAVRQRIVTKFNGTGSTAGIWVFDFFADGGLRFVFGDAKGGFVPGAAMTSPAETVTSGTWQFVAATYDGITVRLYHNAALVLSIVVNEGPLSAVSQVIVIGEDDPVNVLEFFDGLIDEVTLFDRALDQTEIQAIYDAGSAGMSPFCCPWDCDSAESTDGTVGIVDFLALLAQWGQVGTSCDFDGGGVGIVDFLALLAHWGPCP